ncbi:MULTISPECIES: beta-galactosidase [unclassified Microbacterium]|uniref:beta-galactosidase n=1 Tax=unclassified Microbacterium TaxID=2609290 RepID=UPI00214B14C7|nr:MULTISPECIES: beta-galactosidase [unclassified Microbacterium]MCR2783615.1 beta-galactosidase [Microbacterium sp. zg.B96]WIM15526.1 beta-galactosidase [Microbacterium sp. zg-B96]
MTSHPRPESSGILFGAAYYAEYHQSERTATDLDLMKDAGFSVIRVGESVWSTWEPRDGEFDLEWLQPVLDGAHERGISVILGTPTYAVPPWLQSAYPEIAAEVRTGEPMPWGSRQEVDYSHPAFRFHAERVIRAVVARYADHPAVIGYQVDNEPGMLLFHNRGVFLGFVRWLQAVYGDVDTLNREWGLTYWSHRLADWSELWTPDGNSLPQYDLAWRRYQSELTTDFIAWQAGIVREYARPGQFVTTCIAYARPAVDDEKVVSALDVTAGNPYYAMQDHLDATLDLPPATPWSSTGVAALFRQADRLYSSKQDRFLVTETDAQSIGGADFNLPPYPGQLVQVAFSLISRGAAMIEYWHWHTLPYGTETYWGGVLPHSLRPGRVYREVSEIGAALRAIGDALDGFVPDADVALLWSNDSRYAFEFAPPLAAADGGPDRQSYQHIFDAFHRGVIDAGSQARVLHVAQAHALGAAELAARWPVLAAPALYAASDEDLDLLREYAAAGGHLIVGIRTGYGDQEARARTEVAPARLADAAGVSYEEFSNLASDLPVRGAGGFETTDGAAQRWADGLIAGDAEVLARYDHPRFGDFAAITTNGHGGGRITVVGTVPSPRLAADLVRWAVARPVAEALAPERALPVTVSSGTLPDGGRAWFIFNWGWEPQAVTLAASVSDAVSGDTLAAGTDVSLPAWSTRAFLER